VKWLNGNEKKNPEDCVHFTVRRIANSWECLDCGAEFKPVNPKHRTSWSVEERKKE